MTINKHRLGSSLDEFLAEEGILDQAETIAAKRVLAFQIQQLMDEQGITKSALARRMGTSRAVVARLLDPDNPSVTLATLEKVARALGKRLHLALV